MTGTSQTENTLIVGPRRYHGTVILAHGAGAPMDSEFMNVVAERLAEEKLRVVRFEFPYMAARRSAGGKRKPPDRESVLRQCWLDVIQRFRRTPLIIGGKSMGGRIASLVADEAKIDGLICLGYPFHPMGRPEKLRVDHLRDLRTPTLILQGERDPFGKRSEVREYRLPRRIKIHWLADGDHGFKPRKASGRTHGENLGEASSVAAQFIRGLKPWA